MYLPRTLTLPPRGLQREDIEQLLCQIGVGGQLGCTEPGCFFGASAHLQVGVSQDRGGERCWITDGYQLGGVARDPAGATGVGGEVLCYVA